MATPDRSPSPARLRFSAWAPFPVALLVAVTGFVGITDPAIYARETASWATQGAGQDWVNLTVCAPALLVAAVLARRGSRSARVIAGGLLLYAAYSFAIYAFAMHFTVLFPVHCAVLGGASFALVDLLSAARAEPAGWYDERAPIRSAAATLIGVAAVFGLLWLGQIAASLVAGTDPAGLADVGLAANPVHVLDLSLVLPAMLAVGIALLRRRPSAELLAPVLLAFAVMMALAIGGMLAMMYRRDLDIDLAPVVAVAILAVWCTGVLAVLCRHLRRSPRS